MKKLFLLSVTLCFVSILFAQSTHTIDYEPGGVGANWTWVVDQNDDNPPLEIVANPVSGGINNTATIAKFTARVAGQPWALCYTDDDGEFTFDAMNSMVTIMVYKPVTSNVTIKFEGLSPAVEIAVTNTVTDQWEELTYDFSASIGNTYSRIVIIPDFEARTQNNIIYFDNIEVPDGVTATLPEPTTIPPMPPHAEQDVISIYTEVYTNVPGTNFNPNWGQSTLVTVDYVAAGNNTLKYEYLDYQGTQFTTQHVGGYEYLHVDFWTANSTDLGIYLISPGPTEIEYVFTIIPETWVSVDIPLSNFSPPVDLSEVFQFKVEGNGTVYFDNWYFWKNPTLCNYCATSYTNWGEDWISNVSFKTIDNPSSYSVGGYTDYTGISTDIQVSHNYNLEVDIFVTGFSQQYAMAWIDWNQDCDFEDENEAYTLGITSGNYGTHTLSVYVLVPENAISGSTTLRISERWGIYPGPCDQGYYGEAEDYTINIIPDANFSGTPLNILNGEFVNFTDLSTGSPTTWSWSFLGGNPSEWDGQIPPPIQYNTGGSYDVSLAVSNDAGSDTITKHNYIFAKNCYCEKSYTDGGLYWINSVFFNTISNGSLVSYGGYTDYAEISTDIQVGKPYKLQLGLVAAGYGMMIAKAWFDWNQDCDFDDDNEVYNVGFTTGWLGIHTVNTFITAPNDAISGKTTMRVITQYPFTPVPCGQGLNGDAEDYTINIYRTGLELTEMLEGPYQDIEMNLGLVSDLPLEQPYDISPWNYNGNESIVDPSPDYVDWVLIELRDAPTAAQALPGTILERQAAIVKTNGQVVDISGSSLMKFNNAINEKLFVVLHHRNHLSVMSANPVPGSEGIYSLDLSLAEEQVYGGSLGHKLLDSPENTIYNYTIALTSGSLYYFKYINGNDWSAVESVPSGCGSYDGFDGYNRTIQAPFTNMVLEPVCFSGCNACSLTSDSVNVTFQVDMSGQTISPLGVHIAGTFNGWDPTASEMYSFPNDIYRKTVKLFPGDLHKYKFINGNDWGSEEIVPNDCGLVNENNNRAILVPSSKTLLAPVCFGECTSCGSSPDTVYVTFRVDMSNETVSANGVHIVGSFQGWDPTTTEMNPGIWGMISGDGNHNGLIDIGDKSPLWENEAGSNGYIFSDYNLDGESNNIDKNDFWFPNFGKGSQVPD